MRKDQNEENGHKAERKQDCCDVPGMPEENEPKKPPFDREPITLEEPPRKPRDERDRPTEQLIQELDIKTARQAGWLRFKKVISYGEWQRVRDCLSAREIQQGGVVPA